MHDRLVSLLQKALSELGVTDIVPELQVPEDVAHGDYATNVAMRLSKILKKSPVEIANELKELIIRDQKVSSVKIIDRVEVAGPGFINIFLTEANLINRVSEVLKQKERFGKARKQKIMVEFADPNPFKEFHIGHLRNIALGESFSRLLEAIGHEVRRVNYQGDVGMHVAKSLWGLRKILSEEPKLLSAGKNSREKAAVLGRAYARGAQAYEKSKEDKEAIIGLNKKVYCEDPSVRDEWKKGRQMSLDYFDLVYERVGTVFTRFYFESEVAPVGQKIVREHIADGVFEESDGAVIYRGEKKGLHTRVFIAKEGYATYEAKDMGLAILKAKEYAYDLSIIMTGNEQSEYFKVMLAALTDIQPELAAKTRHIPFGMVNLATGKMSSRTGNVVTAEWLIDEVKKRIAKILDQGGSNYTKREHDDITEKGAVASVKYAMLKVGASSDLSFDIEKSISFDGDSGPYLQYTYARARSVVRKSQNSKFPSKLRTGKIQNIAFSIQHLTLNPEERALARLISYFPEIVAQAAYQLAPNVLCTYLFRLAQTFNAFYAKHQILEEASTSDKGAANLRLALTAATAQVLKNGLSLLGIETLEQM
ncbi:arginine--tRNA ligase [Candidatus Gottesmanbacteria bacterium]|nr:arginine--tRNA ligase [Candidatus Gottesmanbacteria bacterium]